MLRRQYRMRKEEHLEPSLEKCQPLEVQKKKMDQKKTGSSRQRDRKEVGGRSDISQKARESILRRRE